MNKENVTKWVSALISGKYPQGRFYLEDSGKFCCLGVACNISMELLKVKRVECGNGFISYNNNIATLPMVVKEWLDISDQMQYTLIGLNDDQKLSFSKIADFLESELKKEKS